MPISGCSIRASPVGFAGAHDTKSATPQKFGKRCHVPVVLHLDTPSVEVASELYNHAFHQGPSASADPLHSRWTHRDQRITAQFGSQ